MQLDFDGYTQDRAKSLLVGYNVVGLGQGIIVTTPVANGAPISFKVGQRAYRALVCAAPKAVPVLFAPRSNTFRVRLTLFASRYSRANGAR